MPIPAPNFNALTMDKMMDSSDSADTSGLLSSATVLASALIISVRLNPTLAAPSPRTCVRILSAIAPPTSVVSTSAMSQPISPVLRYSPSKSATISHTTDMTRPAAARPRSLPIMPPRNLDILQAAMAAPTFLTISRILSQCFLIQSTMARILLSNTSTSLNIDL